MCPKNLLKNLRLIYNPYAGKRKLISQLDTVIRIFQEGGYEVSVHRAKSPQDIEDTAARSYDVDCLVVAGGDGSIHQAVNGLMKQELSQRPVLGILPVGTANDLAYALKLPRSIPEACEVIARGRIFKMDVGLVNNRYFVNVASAGLLSDVSPKVDVRVKNKLGQLAYYLKGLETLPTYKPFRVEYEYGGKNFIEDVLLVLAINGLSVGGLRQVAPRSSLTDGKLDIVIVKQSGWPETMKLVLNLVGGGIAESDKIIQFQVDKIVFKTDRIVTSDLDGEWGPASPWSISMGPGISILC